MRLLTPMGRSSARARGSPVPAGRTVERTRANERPSPGPRRTATRAPSSPEDAPTTGPTSAPDRRDRQLRAVHRPPPVSARTRCSRASRPGSPAPWSRGSSRPCGTGTEDMFRSGAATLRAPSTRTGLPKKTSIDRERIGRNHRVARTSEGSGIAPARSPSRVGAPRSVSARDGNDVRRRVPEASAR